MDVSHVSIQVRSQLPGAGTESPFGCQAANDELSAIVEANPTRFTGWAILAMAMGHREGTTPSSHRACPLVPVVSMSISESIL